MTDIIARHFQVKRGEREMEYVFRTYPVVLDVATCMELPENWKKLTTYMRDTFVHGYPDREGKKSVSEMPRLILQPCQRLKEHDFTKFARAADYQGKGRGMHECVQMYFLRHHPEALCMELPVWDDDLHGHIDLIMLPQDSTDDVYILDFKPNAVKEAKAQSQLHRYRHLLHLRTDIPLKNIHCFYFDDKHTFLVP